MAKPTSYLIPNLSQGVSQQADAQRDPTQAEAQINAVSSLGDGLRKRDNTVALALVFSGGSGATIQLPAASFSLAPRLPVPGVGGGIELPAASFTLAPQVPVAGVGNGIELPAASFTLALQVPEIDCGKSWNVSGTYLFDSPRNLRIDWFWRKDFDVIHCSTGADTSRSVGPAFSSRTISGVWGIRTIGVEDVQSITTCPPPAPPSMSGSFGAIEYLDQSGTVIASSNPLSSGSAVGSSNEAGTVTLTMPITVTDLDTGLEIDPPC